MPNYTYNNNIPLSTDTPSISQGQLKTNCESVFSILEQDLYGFGNNNGGTHQQVTFPINNLPGAQSGLSSVEYTQPGSADPASSQLFFKNSRFVVPLSPIKAFALVTVNTGVNPQSLSNSYNITSVTRSSAGSYGVIMSITGLTASYAIITTAAYTPSVRANITSTYNITNATTFDLLFQRADNSTGWDPPSFSFIVLQV